MKKLHSLGVVFLSFAMTTFSGSTLSGRQDHEVHTGIRDRFVGAWRLASLETEGTDGKIHRADSAGLVEVNRAELSGQRPASKA